MARWYNIGGPCNPATSYMLPAMSILVPETPWVREDGLDIVGRMAAFQLGRPFPQRGLCGRVKTLAYYQESPEKTRRQICGYMDRLGVNEGWLVVFDPDLTSPGTRRSYRKTCRSTTRPSISSGADADIIRL